MIIDFHTHCFPDKLAERAVSALESFANIKAHLRGSRAELIESMRQAGVDLAVNLPVATSQEQVDSINQWAVANNAAPVYSFGAIHPNHPDPDTALARLRAQGVRGVKMHPEYQAFTLGDQRLDRICAACVRHNMTVCFHAGEDLGFPNPPRSNPAAFAALLDRHPKLRAVLAHLGSWRMWDEVERHLAGREVYLDCSFVHEHLDADLALAIIRRHGADKVLFASDSPWGDQAGTLAWLRALPLSGPELEKILGGNAVRLLGLPA